MTKLSSWTWRAEVSKAKLEASTKHVLLTLSLHFNEYGEGAFPSYETLAERTGLSRSTVIRHIEKAAKSGWIIKTTRHCKIKGNESNLYTASVPYDVKIESAPLVSPCDHPSITVTPPLVSPCDPNSPSINIPNNIPIDKRAREREFDAEIDLSDAYYHEGIRLGINHDAMDYHISAFIDVYAGKKKKDWLATWRTYCRNAVQWGHAGTKGERKVKNSGGTISSILENF